MSKKALIVYGIFFALGLIEGTVTYIQSRSNHAPLNLHVDARANAIHIGLAIVLVLGSLVGYIVSKQKGWSFSRLWKAPFTSSGFNRQLFGLLGLPCSITELICKAVGAKSTADKLEKWRLRRFLGVTSPRLRTSYYVLGLPIGIITTIIVVMMWFLFWRAGLQVVGAFDPSFRDGAWGGPTYLGASGAHWMDALIMIYAATFAVRWLVIKQQKLATR